MTTTPEPKIAQTSTEDYCERSNEGHAWSYTSHAGQPRITTRHCYGCGYVSVQPVREDLADGKLTADPLAETVMRLRQELTEAREARDAAARAEEEAITRATTAEEGYRQLSAAIGRFAQELRADYADRLRALAATALQTAPASPPESPQADEKMARYDGPWNGNDAQRGVRQAGEALCKRTDHDLGTNRPLACALNAGHYGVHRFVFVSEPSPAVPEQEREPASQDREFQVTRKEADRG